MIKKVYQQNLKDCGVACLLTIIKYYKGENTFENVRYLTCCSNNGVTALNLVEASKKLGFDAKGFKIDYNNLKNIIMPCICHITLTNDYNHYVVIYKVTNKYVLLFDPYLGVKKYNKDYFLQMWKSSVVIELVPFRTLDVVKDNHFEFIKDIFLKNKYIYFIIIIVSFVSIILSLITNTFLKTLIDGYNKFYVLLIFIFILITKEIFVYIRNKLLVKLENNIDKYLEINTHKKLLSLPNYYFASRSTGDIVTKFNDLKYVKELLIQPVLVCIDIVLIILTSVLLIKININLSLIFFAVCFAYFLFLLLFNKKLNTTIKTSQELNSYKNSILEENISTIETIKNMNLINYRDSFFREIYNHYFKNNLKLGKCLININFIKNFIIYIGINIILFIGIKYVNAGILDLSSLILFNSLIVYFLDPLNEINNLIPVVKHGINSIKRINEIYSSPNSKSYAEISKYDIEFVNFNFSYNNYDLVINDFNYKINFKDKVLVIGASGSGKSTLFKTLNKTYRIDDGIISIGGIDINLLNSTDYISYVSQNEKIFNDTLYNNIVLNNSTDNFNNIIRILKIDELIIKRNINLNSVIEEDGCNLSRGEKQKIIVARALLRNTPIIILDEALNGVDNSEELEIMDSILKEFSNKTIIYISHSKVCVNLFNNVLDFDKIGG